MPKFTYGKHIYLRLFNDVTRDPSEFPKPDNNFIEIPFSKVIAKMNIGESALKMTWLSVRLQITLSQSWILHWKTRLISSWFEIHVQSKAREDKPCSSYAVENAVRLIFGLASFSLMIFLVCVDAFRSCSERKNEVWTRFASGNEDSLRNRKNRLWIEFNFV